MTAATGHSAGSGRAGQPARGQGRVFPEATVGFRSERGTPRTQPAGWLGLCCCVIGKAGAGRAGRPALVRKGRNSLAPGASPPAPAAIVTLPPTRTHGRPGFPSERLAVFGASRGSPGRAGRAGPNQRRLSRADTPRAGPSCARSERQKLARSGGRRSSPALGVTVPRRHAASGPARVNPTSPRRAAEAQAD